MAKLPIGKMGSLVNVALLSEECTVNTLARDLSRAQESVAGYEIKDDSTLAYVSCLVAFETVMPYSNAAEIEFSVLIEDESKVLINPHGIEIEREQLETINMIASHYFHSKRCNLPVIVH